MKVKMFENFENELRTIRVDELLKAMRNAGIERIEIKELGADVTVNVYGLATNVPVEDFQVVEMRSFGGKIEAKYDDIKIVSCISNSFEKEALTERLGVKFACDEVKEDA